MSPRRVSSLLRCVFRDLYPLMRLADWRMNYLLQAPVRRRVLIALSAGGSGRRAYLRLLRVHQIGPTVATGLLHAAHPRRFVPLDRHTAKALLTRFGVFLPPNLTCMTWSQYSRACAAVRRAVRSGRFSSIRAFVRWTYGLVP